MSFNGATIYKPGSYSKSTVDLGGGLPLGPAGLVAVFGEADAGAPGASEVNIANNRYSAAQIVTIRDKYKSGPIVDSANFLFAPASDAAIPSGANTVWFYKTNASVRASVSMDTTGYTGNYDTLIARALEWGTGGNRVSYKSVLTSEDVASTTGTSINLTTAGLGTTVNFRVAVDGVSTVESVQYNTFTPPDATNTVAKLQTAFGTPDAANVNWSGGVSPSMVFTVSGTDTAATVTAAMVVDADAFKLGRSRSFELIESNASDLIKFGLVVGQYDAIVEPSCSITLYDARDLITEEDTSVGGNPVIQFGRTDQDTGAGAVNTATVSVSATQVLIKDSASPEVTYNKSEYSTLKELADSINTIPGWTCSVTNAAYNNLSLDVLDIVSLIPCFSIAGHTPARIKKDADEVAEFFALSSLAEIGTATTQQDPTTGLPPAVAEVFMTGGARGATSTASITAALEAFEKFHVNSVVPLFSRDAIGGDITDGLTDSASAYTIDGINQAVKTHISTMKTTLRRSERQGYVSKKTSEADSYTYAQGLADQRLQLMIQDIRTIDGLGNVKWFQPYALACMVAGARAGSPVGTPLTFKNLNVAGVRHTSQAMTTADADIVTEFDPDLDSDQGIQSGLTFLEAPTTGGFRIVVDNTTYSKDGNFVFNRGNVMYAADTVAYNLRTSLESQFVGQKNTITAATVASAVEATMANFLAQGIIVSSDDAPNGFKNLTVTLSGNTINVGVVIKIVEGIDFILTDISIQRVQSAV